MTTIYFTIEVRSPLAVSDRKPGGSQFQEGLDHIPGRVVRGAVAGLLLEGNAEHSDELRGAFFSGEILFRNAYPAWERAPHVLPATAVSCKDDKGFRPTEHGVFDTLLDRFCWEKLQPPGLLYIPQCPDCGGRVKAFEGFYTIFEKGSQEYEEVLRARGYEVQDACLERLHRRESVPSQLLTRVAINRRRGVAEDELLYAVNALSPFILDPTVSRDEPHSRGERFVPTRYRGVVLVPEGMEERMAGLLRKVKHIGGGTSRGLGRVEVKVVEGEENPSVSDRVGEFNQKLAERWAVYNGLLSEEKALGGEYFIIDLQSEAILKKGWRPMQVFDEKMLKEQTGIEAELVRSYATPGYRGGWQGAWGLPKNTEVIVRRGGVYLFRVEEVEPWISKLEELEEEGIGERRAEGFGQVRICDEFHLITRKEAV